MIGEETLDLAEVFGVLEEAVQAVPQLTVAEIRHARPWKDGVDGAFAARLIRA